MNSHEYTAYIKDNHLVIDADGCKNRIPIIEGFLDFISLDLTDLTDLAEEENSEYIYDQIFASLERHPFLELFPPDFKEHSHEELTAYIDHIRFLSLKFEAMYSFCFSQSFFYEELGELTAHQRLHIYSATQGGDIPQELVQIHLLDGDIMEGFSAPEKANLSAFEQMFQLPAGFVSYIKSNDAKMVTQYRLASTVDALSLAFYWMIDQNLKIKKCKNCDRYFLVRSKRNSDYCDQVQEGQTQSCQQLAALSAFKAKNKDNVPYQIFNKYYKRYHERQKVGTIKRDIFNKWNRQACVMRDECIDGKRDVTEFKQWCFESFPNRKGKEE